MGEGTGPCDRDDMGPQAERTTAPIVEEGMIPNEGMVVQLVSV